MKSTQYWLRLHIILASLAALSPHFAHAWPFTVPALDSISERNLVFCHTTNILPQRTLVVGGRPIKDIILDERGEIQTIDHGDPTAWMPVRTTLHWGLNAAIPKSDTVVTWKGVSRSVPATNRYGIIEPFSVLKNKIYGGYVRDFYSIGDHEVSQRAVVLVPSDEAAAVRHIYGNQVIGYDYNPQAGRWAAWAVDEFIKKHPGLFYMENFIRLPFKSFPSILADMGAGYSGIEAFFTAALQANAALADINAAISNAGLSGKIALIDNPNAGLFSFGQSRWLVDIKHTFKDFKTHRKVRFQNGVEVTEIELLSYLNRQFGFHLREPFLLHIESKLCSLEDQIFAYFDNPDKASELALFHKLDALREEVKNMDSEASTGLENWYRRFLRYRHNHLAVAQEPVPLK